MSVWPCTRPSHHHAQAGHQGNAGADGPEMPRALHALHPDGSGPPPLVSGTPRQKGRAPQRGSWTDRRAGVHTCVHAHTRTHLLPDTPVQHWTPTPAVWPHADREVPGCRPPEAWLWPFNCWCQSKRTFPSGFPIMLLQLRPRKRQFKTTRGVPHLVPLLQAGPTGVGGRGVTAGHAARPQQGPELNTQTCLDQKTSS